MKDELKDNPGSRCEVALLLDDWFSKSLGFRVRVAAEFMRTDLGDTWETGEPREYETCFGPYVRQTPPPLQPFERTLQAVVDEAKERAAHQRTADKSVLLSDGTRWVANENVHALLAQASRAEVIRQQVAVVAFLKQIKPVRRYPNEISAEERAKFYRRKERKQQQQTERKPHMETAPTNTRPPMPDLPNLGEHPTAATIPPAQFPPEADITRNFYLVQRRGLPGNWLVAAFHFIKEEAMLVAPDYATTGNEAVEFAPIKDLMVVSILPRGNLGN